MSTNSTIWAINIKLHLREKKRNTHVSQFILSEKRDFPILGTSRDKFLVSINLFAYYLSEKRDSNPRPRPWQGRAL
ncbi:MAG: hypothetical protein WCG08_11330, partial [Paludibacter sp.]